MIAEPRSGRDGRPLALIKGAGDLASGVALRLRGAGFAVVMTELAQPTVVRRTVAFAEAVYQGRATVEGVEGLLVEDAGALGRSLDRGSVPVVVDPDAAIRRALGPALVVDAVMAKRNTGTRIDDAPAVVALGPGFVAGVDVHAVVETSRGHDLGRVLTSGCALADTGVPGEIGGFTRERLLRAPRAGLFSSDHRIGDRVSAGETIGHVADAPACAEIDGVLRGLLCSGLEVTKGFKIGDIDPRATREHCFLVSDKARAIGGGVLEAACMFLGGVRFDVAAIRNAGHGRRRFE